MKTILLSFSLFVLITLQLIAQDPCIKRTWQQPYRTSWLLNDGGRQTTHIMHWMEYLAVHPNGTTASVTGWEEGGSNVMVFNHDGSIKSIPSGSGTGGWGRNSMIGVAIDDQYTYQLLSQSGCDGGNSSKNSNGLPQYPACGNEYTWKTVRRYNISTGGPAPFAKGYGFMGDMLVVHSGPGDLKGIALLKNELFVADEAGDSVKVYNKTTMDSKPLRKFKFSGGIGHLSPDNKGGMWMLQPKLKQIIRFDVSTGTLMAQKITFPEAVVPSAFFVDTIAGRILVADNGVDQNIKIYTEIFSAPALSSHFGTKFGIFSGTAGKYGPLKFFDIGGVGADASGNIYVANSAPGGGAILQAYRPNGTLMWDKKGLVFTSTACADPNKIQEVYTVDKKVSMDYTKTAAGSEWSFEAYTLNRFKYPDDPRVHGGFFTSAWIKYINGHKFLFATDMYAGVLAGFRFSPETDGEVAIPCLLMNVGGYNANSDYPKRFGSEVDYIWMDKNGDGAIQNDEFSVREGIDNPYSMAIWVDEEGNIWKGVREKGVRLIPLKNMNSFGVPEYDFSSSKLLDIANGEIGINGIKRLVYNRASDELFVAGFSSKYPDRKKDGSGTDTWWSMGSTVCMYKNVLDTLKNNGSVNFKNVKPNWRIFIPFAADGDAGSENTAKSFTVEGDYMFIALARNGNINVYKRSNGEYLGQIQPGAEVNKESGWTDIDYSINVTRTPEEYLIFNEENAFAKVIMYRVKSFATNDQLYADLVPSNLEMLDSENRVISRMQQNKTIRFRVKVTNQGPGIIPEGKTFSNGISFKVNFLIKNLDTEITKTLTADTLTLGLKSGASIVLESFSKTKAYSWLVEKGRFSVTAQVNPMLGSNITECDRTNNSIGITSNSYDTIQFAKHPVNNSVAVNGKVAFSVEALGNEPVTFKWYVNGQEQANSNSSTFIIQDAGMGLNNAKIKVVATNDMGSVESNEAVLTVVNPYGETRLGYLLKQSWFSISGVKIEDLTSRENYPYMPDSISFINKFEVPVNVADNYGVRVSGWLIAPQTGDYTFYIASDDNGQLKLSTDSLPKNLRDNPIALVPEWSDSRQFTKYPQQTSAPIHLESGKKYFVEAMFKEEAGGDNLAIAWKLPDGTTESPIPSSRLAFYTTNNPVGVKTLGFDNPDITLFPVPASDRVFIRSKVGLGKVNCWISDLTGKVLKTQSVELYQNSDASVDISQLPNGLYLVNLRNSVKMIALKLIISK